MKLYHKEINSEKIFTTLEKINGIYLSELSKVEFRSALWKKVRTKEIDKDNAIAVISLFQNDSDKFEWINIDNNLINTASHLLYNFGGSGLCTLDSIQLASALTLKESRCLYFTEDKLLKKLLIKLKLKCY